jgi:hypothetical protein
MSRAELLANGFRVPVTTFGERSAVPMLLCVNAAQQTMGAWGLLAKRFVRRGLQVIWLASSHPGGRSPSPARRGGVSWWQRARRATRT